MRSPGIRRGFVFLGNSGFSGWICFKKSHDLGEFFVT